MEVTLEDKKRDEAVRKELKVCSIKEEVREGRLKWFGHLQMANGENLPMKVKKL